MFRSRFLLTAAVAVVAALAAPATSQAGFLLKLETGSVGGATIASEELNLLTLGTGPGSQGGASWDTFTRTLVGGETKISFSNLVFNGYTIQTEGSVMNVPGEQFGAWLNTDSFTVNRTMATAPEATNSNAQLRVSITATDYELPDPQRLLLAQMNVKTGSQVGTTAKVTAANYFDASNDPYGTDATNSLSVTGNSKNIAKDSEANFSSSSDFFSITNVVTVENLAVGTAGPRSVEAHISSTVVAPAPPGLVMLAGALPFAGLLRLRRRAQTASPATAA